jgi:uncharacterized protein (TIGR02145 family)
MYYRVADDFIFMKKIPTLLLLVVVAITTNAQTPPEAFNYSAVARDANSNPIANSTIGIQMSILMGSPTGNTVYQENHLVDTDDFGLFNLIVGGGSIINGTIADIDWSADDYYLQVGMDATGGTNFLTMGSTQLLSVPYALYAKSAGSAGGISITSISADGDTLYLSNGDFFLSGGSNNSGGLTTPTLTTDPVSYVFYGGAAFSGTVSGIDANEIIATGFARSTTDPFPNNIYHAPDLVGTINDTIGPAPGLLFPGQTYYARIAVRTDNDVTFYGNVETFTTPLNSGLITTAGTGVSDISGNTYPTVILGNGQEWMTENLRTVQYANGDSIQHVTDQGTWDNLSEGAWCHYEYDPTYETPYGKLYNGYSVQDPRNVCPTGWHVPNLIEYQDLENYLGVNPGGKLKAVGTQYWNANNFGTNESGLTGLPGGYYDGDFIYLGIEGWWWTNEPNGDCLVIPDDENVFNHPLSLAGGASIRCVAD